MPCRRRLSSSSSSSSSSHPHHHQHGALTMKPPQPLHHHLPLPLLLLLLAVLLLAPVAVRAVPDMVDGETAASALAVAMAAVPVPGSGSASAIARRPPIAGADLAAWQRALRNDRELKFSAAAGKLIYTCDHLHRPSAPAAAAAMALAAPPTTTTTTTTTNATAVAAAAVPGDASSFTLPTELDPLIDTAFRLHSRPGAPHKIVLDFTGHILRAGTAWGQSANRNGDTPIITPPFDLDNNPASFSNAERTAIVAIWRQVAEDFSTWNVDVTTEEPPGTDDEADASLAGGIGTRVAIGKNNGWFASAGGVAFVSGFGQDWSGPVAFIFNDYPPDVAIAASHEIGHTLGLKHHGAVAKPDGSGATGYYEGHGDWAPVMGMGYGKNVIQWSKGDYPYASEPTQDDRAIISAMIDPAPWSGGGSDVASAEALAFGNSGATSAVASGIVLSGTESHFYKFTASGPTSITIKLAVTPRGPYGNSRTHLAAKARLLRLETSSVVGAQFNNVGSMGIDGNYPETAAMPFDLPAAGVYYIELTGSRNADVYTEYGSSGSYSLIVAAASGGLVGGDGRTTTTLRCDGTTTLALTSAANNCASGVAVRADDVYSLVIDPGVTPPIVTISPPLGTVLTGGTSRVFTAAIAGDTSTTCTTTVTVAACPPLGPTPDAVRCFTPSYTLPAGQCGGWAVPLSSLYQLSAGPTARAGSAPSGTVTTTLPADGILGPGVHRVDVRATSGGATCTAVVSITPCKPVVIASTTAIAMPSSPGVCAGVPSPSAIVTAATLGRGAVAVVARTTAAGSAVPPPLAAGRYYIQVVYPGGLSSAVSASTVLLSIADVENPYAGLKATIVRDSAGFICAKGGSSLSTTACVSVSTSSTGVLELKDNCGVASLTRSYQCAGACPYSMSPSTSKVCVSVRAGGGRVEATYALTVTDKGGRQARVLIPIAGYHYRDAPAGVKCYSA